MDAEHDGEDSTELRARLPSVLDGQAFRSALDRSLQLISLDLMDLCAPVMHERLGVEWGHSVNQYGHDLDARDPLFWVAQLKSSSSPAYLVLPAQPGRLTRQLDRLRHVRNDLFHYSVTYDARRTKSELYALWSVARACGLRCEAEIAALRHHLDLLETGAAPVPPTVEATLESVEEAERARTELEAAIDARERIENELEKARDELSVLRQLHEGESLAAARETSANAEKIRDLEAQALRLTQEAEISAAHQMALTERLEGQEPVGLPELPESLDQGLRDFLEGLGLVRDLINGLAEANPHFDWGETKALAGEIDKFWVRAGALVSNLPTRTPPRSQAENEQLLATIMRLKELSASRTGALQAWLSERDANADLELETEFPLVLDLLEEGVNLATRSINALHEVLSTANIVIRAAQPDLPSPGEVWTWPRGSDVWVLSARHKELRRPRSTSSGEFAARVGRPQEQRLVREWLSIRPEGGRVYIDEDGDASTLGPSDTYIYLGRVPTTQSSEADG